MPTTTRPMDMPEALLGHPKYRVEAQLGVGGMGVVYKAEHTVMGRTVAIKMISEKYTANATAVERFRREVRAAAKLTHPNIVTAYDADEAGGRHFLVMEYIEGVSLDRMVARRGPLPSATACQIARLAAAGLGHAHAKGMVHRDVKPQNIMVNRTGLVKVLDFGLARLAAEPDLPASDSAGPPHQDLAVTGTNMVMGTPDYLAPEQAQASRTLDHRADLYSLGCTLYFALTGRPPFADKTTALDKLIAHTSEAPPTLEASRADLPAGLSAVVAKLLAKNPAERYSSAAEAAAALLPFCKTKPTAEPIPSGPGVDPLAGLELLDTPADQLPTVALTPPRSPRRGLSWAWVAVGVVVLVGGLFVGSQLLSPAPTETDRRTTKAPSAPPSPPPPPVSPAARIGSKVLFVLPHRGLSRDDVEPVRAGLGQDGTTVVMAAVHKGKCELTGGDNRPALTAELALADVQPERFSAILFPGYDVEEFIKPGEPARIVKRLLDHFEDADKVIGSIGTGGRVLLRHGILKGRKAAEPEATVRPAFADKLGGVEWQSWRRVVTDRGVVTASGSADATAFVEAVRRAMAGRSGN